MGSEGVEVGTACGVTVATTLGFLAYLACREAAGDTEELLLLLREVKEERRPPPAVGALPPILSPQLPW